MRQVVRADVKAISAAPTTPSDPFASDPDPF